MPLNTTFAKLYHFLPNICHTTEDFGCDPVIASETICVYALQKTFGPESFFAGHCHQPVM